MTVFAIIPVHNRLLDTQVVVEHLRRQTFVPTMVVVDDGSSDGTGEWLSAQADIQTISSDGSAWWGGAIEKGLRHVFLVARAGDFVLFMNNDVFVKPDYLERLVSLSVANGRCAVGSVVFEIAGLSDMANDRGQLTSLGPRINATRLGVTDAIEDASNGAQVIDLDGLSGRGSLYPVEWFKRCGTMRPALLPHYFADYEIASRFRKAGCRLIVDRSLGVYTQPVYGNDVSGMHLFERLFGKRSSANIVYKFLFFFLVGSTAQRITMPFRFPALMAYQLLRTVLRATAPQPQR